MTRPLHVLIVDDERRMNTRPDNPMMRHVQHSWDAIAELRTSTWDEVWLDFDLGGDDKGSNVARWIRDEALDEGLNFAGLPIKFFIHSFNPSGRMSLQAILRDAGITATMSDLSGFTVSA